MPMKFRDMDKLLKNNGWEIDRVTGSHYIYLNSADGRTVSVPFHGANSDLAPGTEKSVLRTAGLK